MRILAIRNDGIGDLILTLPAISRIRKLYKNAHIALLVREETKDLLFNNPDIDEIIVDKGGIFTEAKGLYKRFDIAFVFYPNLRNSLIAFLSRIPIRVGTGYKTCSIFFNKRIYIHRRDCHEADWCLRVVGSKDSAKTPKIFIRKDALEYAKDLIPYDHSLNLIGIHPACKGSALNLSEEKYARLITKLSERYKTRVIITGSLLDKPMIDRIVSKANGNLLNLCGMTNLGQLIALISLCSVFIGPSTGPMHIASCLGVKTIALFPPLISQSPKKWHPLGEDYVIFTPDIICNEKRCKKRRCKAYNCMERINEEEVLERML